MTIEFREMLTGEELSLIKRIQTKGKEMKLITKKVNQAIQERLAGSWLKVTAVFMGTPHRYELP